MLKMAVQKASHLGGLLTFQGGVLDDALVTGGGSETLHMGKDIAVVQALTSAWTTRPLLWACRLAKVAVFHVLAGVDLDRYPEKAAAPVHSCSKNLLTKQIPLTH